MENTDSLIPKQMANLLQSIIKDENNKNFEREYMSETTHTKICPFKNEETQIGLSDVFGDCKEEITKYYLVSREVGAGSFGRVYKAKCRYTNKVVAIKHIDCKEGFEKQEYTLIKLLREIQIMRCISGRDQSIFVPILYDVIIPQQEKQNKSVKNVFLVMQYEESDLKSVICSGTLAEKPQKSIKVIFFNILSAIDFLHSSNIIHRDIKPSNILINQDSNIKICDFGISRTLPETNIGKGSGSTRRLRESICVQDYKEKYDQRLINQKISKKLNKSRDQQLGKPRSLSSHVGTRWYRSPELCLIESQYDYASDMWSIGCILYEIIAASLESEEEANKLKEKYQYRHVLFTGKYCFPLSPNPLDGEGEMTFNQNDQLSKILKHLDSPDELDLSGITHENARRYLTKLQGKIKPKIEGKCLKTMLQNDKVEDGLKEILSNLLTLNPYFRWTSTECLQHPVFDDVRPCNFNEMSFNKKKLKLPIDSSDAFNYEKGVSEKFSTVQIMDSLLSEADEIHQKWIQSINTHKLQPNQ